MLKHPISPVQYYLQVTEAEERMLNALSQEPELTIPELASKTNLKSLTNLSKSLQEMRRAGYINRDYNDRYAKWSLNQEHPSYDLIAPQAA